MGARKSLNISLEYDRKKATQDLEQLLKDLQKNTSLNFDIDTKSINSSLNGLSDILNNITKQVKSAFNNGNITNQSSQIDSVTKSYEKQSETISKLEKQKDSMQNNVNKLGNNGLVDESVITQLQTKLNSINTNTSVKEIEELKNVINNLNSSTSSITRVQNQITKMESDLQGLKGKYGNSIGDNNSLSQLQKYEAELNNLKNMLAQMKSGQTIFERGEITTNLNGATNASRELKTALSESSSQATTLGEKLQQSLGNVGIYLSTAIVVRQLFQAFKEGVEYVKYLDDSFTDMSMTMNISKAQFNDMSTQIDGMANKLGVTSQYVHDIARVYSNANTSIDEVMEKVKGASELANISGMDGAETTKAVQSITNQFGLMEKEGAKAGEVTSHIGDVLTKVSQNMQMDFATGIREMTQAVNESGSVAHDAGVSLESYVSTIGAMMQQSGKSGSELANAYKMISARTLQVKKLADDMGIDDTQMSKAQKAMTQLGISIKDTSTGSLRSLDDVLKDVAGKWSGMTDAQRQYTSEALAGTRQRAIFMDLMKSMTTQQDLYNKALQSEGALDEANSKKAESIQGKMNTLKNTVNQKWAELINSDAIKGGIDALTKLISVFGNLPSAIGLATTAFLVLKGEAITSLIAITAGETATSLATIGLTSVVELLNKAWLKNPIGLAILGATALTTAFIALQPHIETTTEKIDNLKKSADSLASVQSSQSLAEQYKSLQSTINDSTTSTEKKIQANKELVSVQEQLAKQFPELIDGYNNEGKAIVSNIDAVEKKVNEDKETALKKAQEAYEKAFSSVNNKQTTTTTTGVGDNAVTSSIETQSEVDEFKELREKQSQWTEAEDKRYKEITQHLTDMNNAVLLYKKNGGDISKMKLFNFDTKEMINAPIRIKELEDASRKANESIKNISADEKLKAVSNSLKELKDTGNISDGSLKKLTEILPNLDLSNMSAEEKTKALAQAQNELQNSLDATGSKAESTAEKIKKMSGTFNNTSNIITTLEKALKEFQGHGVIDESTMKSIFDSGDTELISLLADKNNFMKKGNELLKEKKTLQEQQRDEIIKTAQAENQAVQAESQKAQAVTNMVNDLAKMSNKTTEDMAQQYGVDVNNKATSEAQKLAISDRVLSDMAQQSGKTVDELGRQYGVDASNKTSSEIAKDDVVNQILRDFAEKSGQNVDELAKHYGVDVNNKTNAENSKGKVLEQILNDFSKANGQTVDELGRQYGVDVSNFQKATEEKEKMLGNLYDLATKIGEATGSAVGGGLIGVAGSIKTTYGALKTGYNTVDVGDIASNYNPVGVGNVSGAGSSSGSGNHGGKSDKQAEKTINKIKEEYDRYLDLKNAIDKLNDAIADNEALAETKKGQEKINILEQQIDLYNQLRTANINLRNAEQSRLNEVRNSLIEQGFSFNGDDLVNSQGRLKQLEDWYNSQMTGDNQEQMKNAYENIKKLAEEYQKLVRDEIPSATKEIIDMDNKIYSQYKSIAEEVQKQRDDYIKAKQEETEAELKEIEKRRKAKEDAKNKEDEDDELSTKQKSINDLQDKLSIALKTGDAELIKQARKNLADAQEELDKYTRDKDYDASNKRYENEKTYVEDDSKSRIDNIGKQLSDDKILELVQKGVTDINGMLNNVQSSVTDLPESFVSVANTIDTSIIPSLMKANSLISNMKTSMGFSADIRTSNVASKNSNPVVLNVKYGDINVTGKNGEDLKDEVMDILEDNNKQMIKMLKDNLET